MWSDRKRKLVLACVVSSALACALVLVVEASREPRIRAWPELSSGLGLGARAGVGGGYFAYDARLEVSSRADDAPRAGVERQAGPDGVFALSPATRLGTREP